MRTLLVLSFLSLVGCSNTPPQDSPTQCTNLSREFWATTPFPWDNYDTTEVTKMDDGCDLTTITHYVYVPDNGSASGGGGNLFQLQCQYAECDGPLNRMDLVSDPMDIRINFDDAGRMLLSLADGRSLVSAQH